MSKQKKNVFLVGFSGIGKSTLARKTAFKLKLKHFDTDTYIEEKFKTSITDFTDAMGFDYFRKVEHETLIEINKIAHKNIIATGGGMPCFYDNMKIMNENGLTIYIKYPPDLIFYRLKNAKTIRPLMRGFDDEQLHDYISKTLAERDPIYSLADVILYDRNLSTNKLVSIIDDFFHKADIKTF